MAGRQKKRRASRLEGPTGSQGDTGWLDAVRESAARVLQDRRDVWSHHALSDREAERLVSDLLRSLEADERDPAPERTGAEKALLQRLVDLVRQDLLGAGTPLPDHDLLLGLRALEAVRAELEPHWRESVGSQLMGGNALDLVVEIAHDLRSPLTSVMFLADTLRKGQSGDINEVQRQQLGIVYSAALGLSTMANDLMDAARETDHTEHATPESFAISDLVESVRVLVAPMVEEKRLELRSLIPDHDVRIGLPIPLRRVLLNLVTNAIKFTETGSVEILVEEKHGSHVEFAVVDTGRGMSSAKLTDLYQPFRRSQSRTGFHFSNTGLGLSICARMVHLMGGELQVESRPGVGTRFFFELELPRARRV